MLALPVPSWNYTEAPTSSVPLASPQSLVKMVAFSCAPSENVFKQMLYFNESWLSPTITRASIQFSVLSFLTHAIGTILCRILL